MLMVVIATTAMLMHIIMQIIMATPMMVVIHMRTAMCMHMLRCVSVITCIHVPMAVYRMLVAM